MTKAKKIILLLICFLTLVFSLLTAVVSFAYFSKKEIYDGYFSGEVEQTGCVQKIDLVVVIFKRCKRSSDRDLSLDLLRVVIADSSAVSSLAETV